MLARWLTKDRTIESNFPYKLQATANLLTDAYKKPWKVELFKIKAPKSGCQTRKICANPTQDPDQGRRIATPSNRKYNRGETCEPLLKTEGALHQSKYEPVERNHLPKDLKTP